jgi:heat shock protein HslJ
MIHRHLLMGILVLALAACTPATTTTPGALTPGLPTATAPGQTTPTSPAESTDLPDPLANTQWTLDSFGTGDTSEPVLAGSSVTLEFGDDGQAGGTGGCNAFGTPYEIEGSTISFGEITSTLILCEAAGVMDQESRFFQSLQSAGEFELASDRLQIAYGDGEGALNFVRSGAQATVSPEAGSGLLCSGTPAVTDSDWLVCHSQAYGFEVQYPPDAELLNQTEQSARIDLPFAPGTNLSEKYLEITATETDEPCSSPLAEGHEPGTISSETVQINDLEFTKETGHEGAAGSIYEWVAYSNGQDGVCASFGFVLRSSNPDAFSTPPPLFDSEAESEIFEEIVSTFQWTTSTQ